MPKTLSESRDLLYWLRARRVGLGPFFVAFPVLLLGVAANLAPDTALVAIALTSIVVGAQAWIWTRVHAKWRQVYWEVICGLGLTWTIWATTLSTALGWVWAIGVLVSSTVLVAIPHWVDRAKRTQVQMEQMIEHWPIRAARIGLHDTAIMKVVPSAIGWTAKLVWPDGAHQATKIVKLENEIEGALGLQQGQLKIDMDGKAHGSVILNVTLNDPHEKGIFWEIPTVAIADDEVQALTLHGSDPFRIGVRTDGTDKFLQMFKPGWGARSALIAGMKGSGKSGLLGLIWATMALCDDVVQWGIDLKGGIELGPWEGTFDWIVNSREKAVAMIEAAATIVERRSQLMKKYGWKEWHGSPEHPWLLVSIDEAASLLGNASTQEIFWIEEVMRKGRAAGVGLVLATQYPTLEAIGTSQVRQQLDQRFCFRMQDSNGEGYVITEGAVNANGIDADRPGTCYHQDNNKLDRLPMRIVFVGDGSNGTRNTVKQLADLMRGRTPELDRDSVSQGLAELEAYANRETFSRDSESSESQIESGDRDSETGSETPLPEWTENQNENLDDVLARAEAAKSPEQRESERLERESETENETVPLSDEEARVALLAALWQAGTTGATQADLAEAATRKKTWTYDRLNELVESGHAKRTTTGRWMSTVLDQNPEWAGVDLSDA